MKLIVKRSSFWLTDYERWASPSLEKALMIYDVHEHRYTQKLFDYDATKRILKLPRGLGQQMILQKLEADGVLLSDQDDLVDEYGHFVKPKVNKFKIREHISIQGEIQEGSVRFLTQDKDAQKMLALDTGYGKSFCTIMSTHKLQALPMIVCRTLGEQWKQYICDDEKGYTDITEDEIYMISGTPSVEKLMNMENPPYRAYIASTDTLKSYFNAKGDLDSLMAHLGIGVLAYDEAHLNYVANMIIDVNTNVEFKFYLTATPGRSDNREDKMFKSIFRFIPIFGEETHTLKQYYNIRMVHYNSFPTGEQIQKCSTVRGFNSRIYAEYIFSSQPRKVLFYAMIRKYISILLEQDNESRVLIILDRLQDINDMAEILKMDLKISVGRYCTLIPKKEEREKELNSRIVLSTLGSGVVGKDIKGLRMVLAMTSFSSQIITRQLLGRLRYLDGKMVYYFDFTDQGFPAMVGQQSRRQIELKSRAHSFERIYLEFEPMIDELRSAFDPSLIKARAPKPKTHPVRKKKKELPGAKFKRYPGNYRPKRAA